MNTNLQILIAHYQSEYDHLKDAMDQCVSDWDFEGAQAYKEALSYTRNKLHILGCLHNPHFKKIDLLSERLSRMEKNLNNEQINRDDVDEMSIKKINNVFRESQKLNISKSKKELEKLKAMISDQRLDDDKILKLLDGLERKEIKVLEFEIKRGKLFLLLRVEQDRGELALIANPQANIHRYIPSLSALKKLGFDTTTFVKTIPDFHKIDKLKVLEELSIIYFEIFGIFNEERNILIKS